MKISNIKNIASHCINPKNISRGVIASALLSSAILSHGMPTSNITFANGNYCGSYTGDMSKEGRLLTLYVNADQEIVIDTDGAINSVRDSKGNILKDQGKYDYRYVSLNKGKHTIRAVGGRNTTVDICVY